MDVDRLRASFEAQGVMASCASMIEADVVGARFDPEVHGKRFRVRIGLTTYKKGQRPREFAYRIDIGTTHQDAADGFIAAFRQHNGIA